MAQGLNYERRKRLVTTFSKPAPKGISYNRFAPQNVKTKDDVTPAIARFIGSMIKETAISAGQVANEGLSNPYVSPVGSLLGKNFLAEQADRVNPSVGESMQGNVTPMDIFNVMSLIPNPVGAAAKGTSILARGLSKAAPRISQYEPAAAMAGGGMTTRIPTGNILSGLLGSTGTKVAGQTAIPAVQGSNVLEMNLRQFDARNAPSNPTAETTMGRRSGAAVLRQKGEKQHAKRVERELGKEVKTDFPDTQTTLKITNDFANDPANAAYIKAHKSGDVDFLISEVSPEQQAGKFIVWGHPPGEDLVTYYARMGNNAPDHVVSGELNQLEQRARLAGENFKTYKEVMEWGIGNKPEYRGLTLDGMIARMGKPTKYFE
jgi:hypothetical protein